MESTTTEQEALDALKDALSQCVRCSTHEAASDPNPLEASLSARFVVLESSAVRRFGGLVRASERPLWHQMKRAGLDPDEAAWLYLVNCPSFASNPDSVHACRSWLTDTLGVLDHIWLIITVGEKALFRLTGVSRPVFHRPMWHDNYVIFAIRDWKWYQDKEQLSNALVDIKRLLNGVDAIPFGRRPASFEFANQDIAKAMNYKGRGWVHIYAHILEDFILLARDAEIVTPYEHRNLVRYNLEEIVKMRGMPERAWRALHGIKKELGGELIIG